MQMAIQRNMCRENMRRLGIPNVNKHMAGQWQHFTTIPQGRAYMKRLEEERAALVKAQKIARVKAERERLIRETRKAAIIAKAVKKSERKARFARFVEAVKRLFK